MITRFIRDWLMADWKRPGYIGLVLGMFIGWFITTLVNGCFAN